MQFTLFNPSNQAIMEHLAGLDFDSLKPLDALNLLAELKKEIEKG
ncbi:MAG: hypothetical protein O7A06_01680 [Acidobacteria bacterium]|nr:hypothetical protein [Acidobacteriota bacterium]MCZ6750663.1 hypothetical protein [Acidobacteriota bacterium]